MWDFKRQVKQYGIDRGLNNCQKAISASVSDGLVLVDSLPSDQVKKIVENSSDAIHLVALAIRETDGDYRRVFPYSFFLYSL